MVWRSRNRDRDGLDPTEVIGKFRGLEKSWLNRKADPRVIAFELSNGIGATTRHRLLSPNPSVMVGLEIKGGGVEEIDKLCGILRKHDKNEAIDLETNFTLDCNFPWDNYKMVVYFTC